MPDQPTLFDGEGAPEAPKLPDVILLLNRIAETIKRCDACGARIYMVRHYKTNALCPYTEMAVSHSSWCGTCARTRCARIQRWP